MNGRPTSSPAATGGAGTFFEQHVAAYWLAQLLVRGVPPVLIETTVKEISFQTEHMGWHTDDFLVVCEQRDGSLARLAGQVKRSFTVSAANENCRTSVLDFWNDFDNPNFSRETDRFVLVTLRGTNTLLDHFVGLLDCARAARKPTEFEHRLSTPGFISGKAVHYGDELRKIIAEQTGHPVAAADIWAFLRLLHVLSLDLDTSTRQTEAQIKTLLGHTVTGGQGLASADDSWNRLLGVASAAITEARSLSRPDLPTELLRRHDPMGVSEQSILRSLVDHTAPILDGIRSTIGPDFQLQRPTLVQNVLTHLETAQVVLVSGPAGSGKSVIGKGVAAILSEDHFVFGFRVEEFAQAHIDQTLLAAQIPANAKTLAAILSTQGRKVILIESVERLLEKSTRDAFSDLMTLAAADRGLAIILTCRDYSVEQVRASFLRPAGINHAVVDVPPLEDVELAEVETALPVLSHPLKNSSLRRILRNPYFLDKAHEISWSAERTTPESERQFRELFWRQIVCADQDGVAGMARRREEVFQEIAVRRARLLSTHVVSNDLDTDVLASLRRDSLIVSSEENSCLVATAHDVLEDWAILHWLEERQHGDGGSFRDLSCAIGAFPAIRRSYRKWIAEIIERDPAAADRLFRAAVSETETSAQFRDDTLVSLLRAPLSPEFLSWHESRLTAENASILKRVIHLLRIACVTTPAWLTGSVGGGSAFHVPDGPAWAAVLSLAHRNMADFRTEDRLLLLGFIEDAVRSVTWWAPELDGAEHVAGIAHWLLPAFDGYGSNDSRKRVLKVLAKIPTADTVRFEAVLRGAEPVDKRRGRLAVEFRELLFDGLEGMPAARDLPDLVMELVKDHLLASEDDLLRDNYWRSRLDMATYFGIKERMNHRSFPASAYRGPWMHLLRHHPPQALDFYIEVFNHSVDWYAHRRAPERLEPAWEIEVTFADGHTHSHWGNERLWNLYRGTSVGPYVLQSLLMALEAWLLEFAENTPNQLDLVLVDILRRTESAALAAVVASVATAHPHSSGEALLVLLSAPDYIGFDRTRLASEYYASTLQEMFPRLPVENGIYEAERREADGLPHRNGDLEKAIANLQLGPFSSRVQAALDAHRTSLPPSSEQTETDRIWRLAIHRMDLRQYTVAGTQDAEKSGTEADETTKGTIRLEPRPAEPDVQAMVDEHAAELGVTNARLRVLMWARRVFERRDGDYDPSEWRSVLAEAQEMDRDAGEGDYGKDAPGIVASVCVRDHWTDMTDDERNWCVDTVCSEILRTSNLWSPIDRMQRSPMAADRSCASVVPLLLTKPLTGPHAERIRQAFASAMTHPIEEVRQCAIDGLDGDFWAAEPSVAMRCVNAIAVEAVLADKAWKVVQTQPYGERHEGDDISANAAKTIREQFWEEFAIADDVHAIADVSAGFGARASAQVLAILGGVPADPVAADAFSRASRTLVDWWDADRDWSHRHERDFEAEYAVSGQLQRFVMRAARATALQVLRPLLDAVDRHPKEAYRIVEGLTVIEDRTPNTEQYWYLWDLFADRVRRATWIAGLDEEHPVGRGMLSAIFLTSGWRDDVRHWKSLDGHADRVHALFEQLPPSAIVLDNYLRFLYHIGEKSLPDVFLRISDVVRRGDSLTMLSRANAVFLLEVLLQRYVYGRPLELKRDAAMRQAVLHLLDVLVEKGSSAAFRMRDDFVTPLS